MGFSVVFYSGRVYHNREEQDGNNPSIWTYTLYTFDILFSNWQSMVPIDDNLRWFSIIFVIFTIYFPVIFLNVLIALVNDNYYTYKENEKAEDTRAKIMLIIELLSLQLYKQDIKARFKGFYMKFCKKKKESLNDTMSMKLKTADLNASTMNGDIDNIGRRSNQRSFTVNMGKSSVFALNSARNTNLAANNIASNMMISTNRNNVASNMMISTDRKSLEGDNIPDMKYRYIEYMGYLSEHIKNLKKKNAKFYGGYLYIIDENMHDNSDKQLKIKMESAAVQIDKIIDFGNKIDF